jgi:hypothetical protein
LEKEIPLTTDEGYEYLIVFKEFSNTPRDYGVKIIDVSIILMEVTTFPCMSISTHKTFGLARSFALYNYFRFIT